MAKENWMSRLKAENVTLREENAILKAGDPDAGRIAELEADNAELKAALDVRLEDFKDATREELMAELAPEMAELSRLRSAQPTNATEIMANTPVIAMVDVWPDHDQKKGHQFIGKQSDGERAVFVEVRDFANDSGWESLPERMKAFAKHACDWVTDQPQVLPKFNGANKLRATFEILKGE